MVHRIDSATASKISSSSFPNERKGPSLAPEFVREAGVSASRLQSAAVSAKDQMPGGNERANHAALLSLQVYAMGQMANSAVGMQLPINYNLKGREHEVFFRNENNKLTFYCPTLRGLLASPNILSMGTGQPPHFGHKLTIDDPFVGQLANQAIQSLEMHYGPRADPNFQPQPLNAVVPVPTPAYNLAASGHMPLGARFALPTDPATRL